jgi:hypothetical protein
MRHFLTPIPLVALSFAPCHPTPAIRLLLFPQSRAKPYENSSGALQVCASNTVLSPYSSRHLFVPLHECGRGCRAVRSWPQCPISSWTRRPISPLVGIDEHSGVPWWGHQDTLVGLPDHRGAPASRTSRSVRVWKGLACALAASLWRSKCVGSTSCSSPVDVLMCMVARTSRLAGARDSSTEEGRRLYAALQEYDLPPLQCHRHASTAWLSR